MEPASRQESPQTPISAELRRRLRAPTIEIFLLISLLLLVALDHASCVVVHQVRFVASKSGRTDYALTGETIELSCHYLMKDDIEDIKQLVWSKDGQNFLRWRKNKPGLEVLSYTFKGHFDASSKHSHIIIHNVTTAMHGSYNCTVRTDLGIHTGEHELIVISKSYCKLNDWRVISQPNGCRELFKLDCRNMFPRPVSSCGLWDSGLDKFIRSVDVDISEEQNVKGTFRVKYTDKFELPERSPSKPTNSLSGNDVAPRASSADSDLLRYADHLMFKCDIIVPETSWKLSLSHRMFDYQDGCNQDPLEAIERMRANYSQYAAARMQSAGYLTSDRQLGDIEMLASSLKYELLAPQSSRTKDIELNCWQRPKIGTLAKLSCDSSSKLIQLTGANLLECRAGGWALISEPQSSQSVRVQQANVRLPGRTTSSPQVVAADGREQSFERNILEDETITVSTKDSMNIPTTQEILSFGAQSVDEVTPSQLATLLPRCVTTRRLPSVTSNRLEEARILGSSYSAENPHTNIRHHQVTDSHRAKDRKSFFNFPSSSSSRLKPDSFIVMLAIPLMSTLSVIFRFRPPQNDWPI